MPAPIVRIDGWPVAIGTARAFLTRLKPAFDAAFPDRTLHIRSGFRSYQDQVDIFLKRYKPNAWSPFGDYRWWNGIKYGRTSGEGTVAQPGTSNHATGSAIDIYDSAPGSGVATFGTAQDRWMQNNAAQHGFSNEEGNNVGEAWHKNFTGNVWEGHPMPSFVDSSDPGISLDARDDKPASPSTSSSSEDLMQIYAKRKKNGDIYLIRTGKKKLFKDVKDYQAWGGITRRAVAAGASNYVSAPDINRVPAYEDWELNALFEFAGVPGL